MSSPDDDESLSSLDQLDLSDEFPEMTLMREGTFPKEEPQARPSHWEDAGDTARPGALWGRGAALSPVPVALASATVEGQFAGELDFSSPEKSSAKKMQSVVCGKRGGRPSYLPQATPGKNVPQEVKPSVASKVVLERKSQACLSGGPLGPAVFSPISGFPVLGRAEKYSLVPSGPSQPTCIIAKKPVAIRARKCELVAGEDNPNREPAPKGLLPASKLGFSHLSVHRGGYSDGDPKTRAPHVSANSQLLAMAQGGFKPRVPLPSGDQGLFLHPPRQERKQLLPETQCCPQCPVLQKEIDRLKDELAAMQCLVDKFQML